MLCAFVYSWRQSSWSDVFVGSPTMGESSACGKVSWLSEAAMAEIASSKRCRAAAQALDETALIASEPVTIVLSEKGWVRAAKGHEIDAEALSYRSGDRFMAAALGRSNQQVVFLDSTGRAGLVP